MIEIKEEENVISQNSLLDSSSSFSHPLFDSVIDQNPFWHHPSTDQLLTSTEYYLPINNECSSYDPPSNPNYLFSSSDMESCPSPSLDSTSNKNHLHNSNQSRKDKSLGLLCQR